MHALWLIQTRIHTEQVHIANDVKKVKYLCNTHCHHFLCEIFTKKLYRVTVRTCRICVRIQLQINTVRRISILPDSVEREREPYCKCIAGSTGKPESLKALALTGGFNIMSAGAHTLHSPCARLIEGL